MTKEIDPVNQVDWTAFVVKAKSKVFKGAIQEYTTPKGVVAVSFTTSSVYFFIDDDGYVFTAKEMQKQMKSGGADFPFANEDVYSELFSFMNETPNEYLVNLFDFSESDLADMKHRLELLGEFAKEVDFKL